GFGDDAGIFFVIRILGPAVEKKIVVGDFAGFVSNADRAGIAHPAAIGRHAEKINGVDVCSGLLQNASNARFGGTVFNEKIDALDLRQVAYDFCKGPRNGCEFSGPVSYFVWPAEPGGFVRFPFGGHAKAERAGRFYLQRGLHWEKKFNTEITEVGAQRKQEGKN